MVFIPIMHLPLPSREGATSTHNDWFTVSTRKVDVSLSSRSRSQRRFDSMVCNRPVQAVELNLQGLSAYFSEPFGVSQDNLSAHPARTAERWFSPGSTL